MIRRILRPIRRWWRCMLVPSSWPMLAFAVLHRLRSSPPAASAPAAIAVSGPRPPRRDPREDGAWPHVPRIIFQTWKTRAGLPSNFAVWSRSFHVCNPSYDCVIWDDADNRSFIAEQFPWFLPWYDGYPKEIFRADVVRFFFLYRFGGIYADMDTECLKPLDALLHAGDVVLGRMGPDPEFEHAVPNAMMAARPRHLLWLLAITVAIERARESGSPAEMLRRGPERVTGPVVLKDTLDLYLGSTVPAIRERARWVIEQMSAAGLAPGLTGNVKLLAPELWYPVDWNNPFHGAFRATLMAKRIILDGKQSARLFPKAYMVTYWSHSW
jgi:inositol phosphorylceramide mannosyltransferase catalytic subunit